MSELLELGIAVNAGFFALAELNLGANTPEEIALEIIAEIQRVFAQGSGLSLREKKMPIHAALKCVDRRGAFKAVKCRRHSKKIGAVILAAGGSSRFGQSKQLIPFRGKSFVRRIIDAACDAGCSPVVVVVGSEDQKLHSELDRVGVVMVQNQAVVARDRQFDSLWN